MRTFVDFEKFDAKAVNSRQLKSCYLLYPITNVSIFNLNSINFILFSGQTSKQQTQHLADGAFHKNPTPFLSNWTRHLNAKITLMNQMWLQVRKNLTNLSTTWKTIAVRFLQLDVKTLLIWKASKNRYFKLIFNPIFKMFRSLPLQLKMLRRQRKKPKKLQKSKIRLDLPTFI